jgi:hypothetical protein
MTVERIQKTKICRDDYLNSKKIEIQFGLKGEILPLRPSERHTNGAAEARKAQQF